jgi:hypothetical protein
LADSNTCSAPATVCCATSVATRLTLLATDRARFVTPDAAFETVRRLGNDILRPPDFAPRDLRADDPRFDPPFLAGLERLADVLRPPDLRPALFRAGPFRPALFRAGPRIPREPDLREADPLDEDFLPPERAPAFLPPFEPPRDDFLAAAMIRAPI